MAHPSKRITRKDIRRPDQFVTLTGRFFHFVTQYRSQFLILLAVIIVALLALWDWDAYRARQNRMAAQEYAAAINLYHSANYLQAADGFSRVKTYTSSPYSRLGLLYQANSYMALGEIARATALLQEFLQKEGKGTLLRQLGLLTLASLQERTGRCREAVSNFAAAEKIAGPYKDEALLGKARCSYMDHNFKEALNSYRQYLTNYPASEKTTEISLRIQEVEVKIAGGSGAK